MHFLLKTIKEFNIEKKYEMFLKVHRFDSKLMCFSISYWKRPLLVKLITHSCRTNIAVYEYSPFECLPINAYFCIDFCHVVTLCLLFMINLWPTGPAGEVPNPGQCLNPQCISVRYTYCVLRLACVPLHKFFPHSFTTQCKTIPMWH